ncbi:MAG: glycosyltransferase, partial [Elusimicrobia bacterium]|nr:glycosyltransferase [Elusimicrobiota bacterium]
MIKVAYLSFDSNLFGSERSMLAVMSRLDRKTFSPCLVMTAEGPLAEAARALGFEVYLFPWLAGPFGGNPFQVGAAALRLACFLRRNRIGIAKLNRLSFGHLAVLNLAAALARCKTVVAVRMPGSPISAFQKLTLLGTDLVLSVAESSVAPWRTGWFPAALRRRIHVVPSGRDIAKLKSVERDRGVLRALGIPDGAPVAGMVAAILPDKRQDLFLRAAEAVLREVPDAWFVLVGGSLDGLPSPYQDSLQDFLKGKPLGGRVVFTGYRNDAIALIKNFDALVLPSEREGIGGVLIEAMALGAPIVAHRVGGIPEIVEDGATGLLIDRQEPGLYAAAMVRLLREPGLAARLRASAFVAADRFDAAARRTGQFFQSLSPKKIRFACISFDSNLFGSERSMLDTLGNLDRARFEPCLIAIHPGPLIAAARARGIEVVLFPWLAGPFGARPVRLIAAAARLTLWLRRRGIKIAELNRLSFGHLAVLNLSAQLAGCRTVVRVRMPGASLSVCQKLVLRWADLVISVSAGTVSPWKAGWSPRALAPRLLVVPDSRDIGALKSLPPDRGVMRALGIPDGAPVVGIVAALVANKRQDLFLAAAEAVLRRIPDAWFVVVGGPLKESRKEYLDSLPGFLEGKPLQSRVVFTGLCDDAPALMKNFSLLILPSDREAFGGVLIEAMALGVPVIAHRVDGMPEVVAHGVNGLLIDRQDPELYAEAAIQVLSDAGL